jgi:hypothetical protein
VVLKLPHLPVAFFDEHDNLKAIRRAAHADRTPPDVVLIAVLARIATLIPVDVTVNHGPLNFIGALVGQSGSGKSSGHRTAQRLVPNVETDFDGVPLGSGEGIVQAYMGRKDDEGRNLQERSAVLFYADEGERLLSLKKREGSTTLEVIRTAWSGGDVGMMNASRDTTRRLIRDTYRFVLLIGFQPPFAADLLADQVAGTPQRFLWAAAGDPTAPPTRPTFPDELALPSIPTDPYRLDEHVRDTVDGRRHRVLIEGGHDDPHESHAVQVQLRVAALLDVLTEGSGRVTPFAWHLAGQVVDNSRNVRDELLRYHQEVNATAALEREVSRRRTGDLAVEQVVNDRLDRIGEHVVKFVSRSATEGMTEGAIGKSLNSRDRPYLDDVLGRLVERGHVTRGQGRYYLK